MSGKRSKWNSLDFPGRTKDISRWDNLMFVFHLRITLNIVQYIIPSVMVVVLGFFIVKTVDPNLFCYSLHIMFISAGLQ